MTEFDRRTALFATLGAAIAAGSASAQTALPAAPGNPPLTLSQPDETIDLWPKSAPGMPAKPPVEVTTERSKDTAKLNDRAVAGVSTPRMAVFRPAKPNGASLLVFPGGGYVRMAMDKEGYEIGRLLAARGVTVFVLFYRLPGEGWANRADVPLQDAQRAMRLIRSRATKYGLDPERIGAMGFSAGGHLCADLVARFATRIYDPVDAADTLSARPMIAAPIYPVVSMDLSVAHAGSREALLGPDPSPALIAGPQHHRRQPALLPMRGRGRRDRAGREQPVAPRRIARGQGAGRTPPVRRRRAWVWAARYRRQAGRRLARLVRRLGKNARLVTARSQRNR
jgi:acetyl esterase/lipase